MSALALAFEYDVGISVSTAELSRTKFTGQVMRPWCLVGCVCLVVGCQESPPAQPAQQVKTVEDVPAPPARVMTMDQARTKWVREEVDLLAQLETDSENAQTLYALATTNHNLGFSGEGDPRARMRQASEFLGRAIAADPKILDDDGRREAGRMIFFNAACGSSLDEDGEASLHWLRKAVAAGWDDLDDLKSNSALEFVRQNPAFAEIEEPVEQAFERRIDKLFESENDFTFDFDLEDPDAERVKKSQFAGKLLMVNIWATWCPPCCDGIVDLVTAVERYKSQGFEVVGINDEPRSREDGNNSIIKAREELNINFPCVLATAQTLDQLPSDRDSRPTAIFFHRDGTIAALVRGQIRREKLRIIIERLLAESTTTRDKP